VQLRRKRKVPEVQKAKKAVKWEGPAVGSRRKRIRFAWLPVRIDSGIVVWLEKYLEHSEFCHGHDWKGYSWKVWKREVIIPGVDPFREQ